MDYMRLFKRYKERLLKKRQDKEFETMHSCIQCMLGLIFSKEILRSNAVKASEDEIDILINNIPSNEKYLIHSIQNNPDKVYYVDLEKLCSAGEKIANQPYGSTLLTKRLPDYYRNDKLPILFYDDFGLPGTHLCARRGYIIYHPVAHQLIAYHWVVIS